MIFYERFFPGFFSQWNFCNFFFVGVDVKDSQGITPLCVLVMLLGTTLPKTKNDVPDPTLVLKSPLNENNSETKIPLKRKKKKRGGAGGAGEGNAEEDEVEDDEEVEVVEFGRFCEFDAVDVGPVVVCAIVGFIGSME